MKTSIDITTGQRSLFLDSSIFFLKSTRIFFSTQISKFWLVFFFRSWTYILQISTRFLLHSMYFTSFDLSIMFSTCFYYRYNFVRNETPYVALKSGFSDPKWDLPSWFSDSRANFHLWTVVLPSYLTRNVTQFHLFWSGLLVCDSKMAAYQQFLKHIYWNFMESGISGIGIWLNLWVSASNELGKSYF